jgi:hypothetical protein
MGIVENVGYDQWPRQSDYLNSLVAVCFHYDASRTITGVIVRDDREAPHQMIIKLDDGRYVLSTECMWRPLGGWQPGSPDTGEKST